MKNSLKNKLIKSNFRRLLVILFVFTGLNSFSQDVVVFNSGDSIVCKITKITKDTIYMTKTVKDQEIKTFIHFNKVKDYRFHTIEFLKNENDTSFFYSLIMADGNALTGKVLSYDKNSISFEDNNLGKLSIHASSILSIERENSDGFYLVKLTDGNQLHGRIVKRTKDNIIFETKTLGEVTVSTAKIKKMQLVEEGKMEGGKYWFPNPNNTRYFFAPTSMNLKKGEAYYQNVFFLMNSANYGVTDRFSIGGGIIIPFAIYVTPKISFKITDKFYAGVGVIVGAIPGPSAVGITYGIATYGTNEHNITLGAGYGFYDDEFAERPIITVNGMTRVSRKIALVTENWSIPFMRPDYDNFNWNSTSGPDEVLEFDTYFSYGCRIMGEKITIDIALVNSKDIFEVFPIGVPYVDFVYKFGK